MTHSFNLQIGPVGYFIHSENPLVEHETCANFLVEGPLTDAVDVEIRAVQSLQEPSGKMIHQSSQRLIYREEDGREHRVNVWMNQVTGLYHELDSKHILVEVLATPDMEIPISTSILELFALEKDLLANDALVLHSSFIEFEGKAILFTAPSGTGKSTQASLWNKFEGVETINGDRSIVHRVAPGQFVSRGLPFCGSSQIHVNRSMPTGAIVFIEQHPTNVVERMNPAQAYGKLFGEMSINSWNRAAVEKSLQIIEDLVGSVPMVHLKCNMEQDAVTSLKNYLHEKAGY